MRKELLRLLHNFELCPNLCNIKYPWSWRSKLNNKKLINKIKNPMDTNFKSEDNREFIHKLNFKDDSADAYKIIYECYIKQKDFLDHCYTSPSLSLALNELREKSNIDNLSSDIILIDVKIISSWYEYGLTKSNDKFMGFYNKEEIIHEISAGVLGPEVRKVWDQQSIKQKVKVLYESNEYLDILEWERDVMMPDQDWQVSNINKILI